MSNQDDYKVYVNEKGERFVEFRGELYPEGFVPDPTLDERELFIARKKEQVWTWALRFGILALLAILALIIYFAVTK